MLEHGKTAILSEIFFFVIQTKSWHQIYVHSSGLDENKGGVWGWNSRCILRLMLRMTRILLLMYTLSVKQSIAVVLKIVFICLPWVIWYKLSRKIRMCTEFMYNFMGLLDPTDALLWISAKEPMGLHNQLLVTVFLFYGQSKIGKR